MESWLSVGPRYNLHYIYLPRFVVLPKCRPEGPSPSKHKAVKRFNSIRTATAGGGWARLDSTNLTPPIVSRFGIRSRIDLPPYLSVLTPLSILPCLPGHPFRSLFRCFNFFFLSLSPSRFSFFGSSPVNTGCICIGRNAIFSP